ncbi:acyl-CoA dehydrogenase family protein [Neoroseomonas soli]|uniref:Acyl-CoA dehydrogenase n=1 Tax=Neoroseomonas soli TaxID=1081025 RepID=A0A9X9WVM0_9PROT|nr:acyl-CoA dehydrogenase family protein [Neoroseomonas soli]MBR0671199.1 acyl-CoA dehydrogenase [Neoroseomonas soli]
MSQALDDRSESIRMIRDSAGAVAPRGGDTKRVRALRFTNPGFDKGVFAQMGELGWIGLAVSEDAGGAGLGMSEAVALAEEIGAGLAPEPLIPAMLSARLLAAAEDKALLAPLLEGGKVVLTAWQEKADTLAVPGTSDAPRVFVPMAAGADAFLLPVREGNRIALLALDAAGADVALEKTMDGGNVGTLRADLSRAARVADDIGAVVEQALDEAALATAGHMLGLMEKAFEMTLAYLRTRQQFGRIIGTFQSLQHRAADLKVHIALTRAAVESAAAALDAGATGAVRQAAVSKAKHRAAESGLLVLRQCIQLHGGIGYTDEYDVGMYLRRGMVIANQYGSATLHRRRFMALAPEDVE